MNDKLKFNLSPGYWQYWFRDKETLAPLSARYFVIKDPNITSDVEIDIPEELIGNSAAIIHVVRIR